MRHRSSQFTLLMLTLSACATPTGPETQFSSGTSDGESGAESATQASDSAPTGDASTTDSSEGEEGPILDVGGKATAEGGDMGCEGIDFLFVIDNSGSMFDEQQELVASFPDFADSMAAAVSDLGANDFHIMAVDTDGTDDPVLEPGCEGQLGAGRTHQGTNHTACAIDGDQRYLTDGQSDLPGTFSCIALVGDSGSSDERPMEAIDEATSSSFNSAGGCNEDFLRNDHLLVVVIITDEEDDAPFDPSGGSPGDPASWRQGLLDAKGGNESAIVILGLVSDAHLDNGICQGPDGFPAGEESPRLHEFIDSFDNSINASVCLPGYADFFQQAVELIDLSCENYTPVD